MRPLASISAYTYPDSSRGSCDTAYYIHATTAGSGVNQPTSTPSSGPGGGARLVDNHVLVRLSPHAYSPGSQGLTNNRSYSPVMKDINPGGVRLSQLCTPPDPYETRCTILKFDKQHVSPAVEPLSKFRVLCSSM